MLLFLLLVMFVFFVTMRGELNKYVAFASAK